MTKPNLSSLKALSYPVADLMNKLSNFFIVASAPDSLTCALLYKQSLPSTNIRSILSHSLFPSPRGPILKHHLWIRLCLLIKLFDIFDVSQFEAWKLLDQRDELGRVLVISHLCHCITSKLCIRSDHFELESKSHNHYRNRHQNGNEVCNCAELCAKPCLVIGNIGMRVLDKDGVLIRPYSQV